jgi:hypothetical protein
VLQSALPIETMSAINIPKFVKFVDCHLNMLIVDGVLLTVSGTITSTKKSFLKLKLIKIKKDYLVSHKKLMTFRLKKKSLSM